jgi:hypothetical protein
MVQYMQNFHYHDDIKHQTVKAYPYNSFILLNYIYFYDEDTVHF